MADVVIYHNPKCSKSRAALALLEERGVAHDTVLYLRDPLDAAGLTALVEVLDDPPAALVRKDGRFRELGLEAGDYTEPAAVVALLSEHPELMERPVVVAGGRAVIGRPTERVAELLT